MCENSRSTEIITRIYDAALDPALWPDALEGIAAFVNGQVGGLLVKDQVHKCVSARCHSGTDPHYMQLYERTYSQLGPVATSLFCGVGRVVAIPDLMPYKQFCQSRFYEEWARPQGWVDIAVAGLENTSEGCVYLSMARDETSGMVDDEMRRRMVLVAPHVQRAVLIGRMIEFRKAAAATFAEMLDNLSFGLFLVDARGVLVHANAAGHEMLAAGDLLRASSDRLTALDAQVDQALRDTVAAAGRGDADVGIRGIALPLTAHDAQRYVAHVLPLTSGARQSAHATYAATAALFVRKAAMEYPSHAEVIGKTYHLTPAELRVLFGIVQIGGVPEVAAAFGVADATIKTHVSRLYEKTGTGRQADLVRLVAGFSLPLAH
ncbi:MAG: LuxR family transcriptional regulator [Proteobacteria bacterium]|nr:MAG: LuxR family transcriptional regulator [Pseudomonadota bacterium]